MSQINVERVIGRLATDEAFRRRFVANAAATLSSLAQDGIALTVSEREALAALDPERVTRFAESIDPRIQKSDLLGEAP